MGQHQTDFREYRRGIKPEDWMSRWLTGDKAAIEGATYDLAHRNAFRLQKGLNGRSAITWNAPESDTGIANQIVRVLFHPIAKFSGDATVATPILRGSGTTGAESCYRLIHAVDGTTLALHKLVAGTATSLGSATVTAARLGGFYWYLFEATGTTIRVKYWADGDAEPGSWTVSVTDSALASGWVGLLHYYDIAILDVPFFSVGTNGAAAPFDSALSLPLDQWSQIPDVQPEITFGVERADPVTGVVSKKWYTNRGPRHTGASDFPPNAEFESVIVNAGGFGQRLEADALFGAQALTSIQQIELRNIPTMPNGPGLLDDWDDYTFAARPFEIRIGDTTKPHRAFELISTPDVYGEPAVTPEKATVQLANPAGAEVSSDAQRRPASLKQALRVRAYLGIPTGVAILTTAPSGASAPSHAAYALTSFVAKGRFRTSGLNSGGGSGFSVIADRQISSTNRQFQLAMYWLGHATLAGRIQVDVSVAGVSTALGTTAARYDDGLDHWWALGIKDLDRYFFLVDGVVVLSGAMTGSVDTPAAAWKWATGAKNGLFFDHGMSTWLTEDEVRASMAARLPQPPPLNWVALWPGDDAAGNTATDYSANANHATLAGVSGTNFRWDPTDLGMPEQAGRPMPLVLGMAFNARAEMADALRGRFRFSDGLSTGIGVSRVKARALPITLTTDYTLPTPGVVDMVTAQSEPVTVDLAASASPESPAIHLPRVISDSMLARHPTGAVEHMDHASFEALRKILPFRGGGVFSEPPSGEDWLNQLGPLGGHYFQDRSGRVAAGYLLPPVNPGPYGQEGLLEFLGLENRGVTFAANSAFDLNQTLAAGTHPWFGLGAWIKPSVWPMIDSSAAIGTYFPQGMTVIDRVLGASGYYLGIDGTNGAIVFGAPGVTAVSGNLHYLSLAYPFQAGRSYFIACEQDFNTRQIRVFDPAISTTNSVALVTQLTTGAMVVPTGAPLRVGHGPQGSFFGWIGYVMGSSSPLSISDWVDTSAPDAFNIMTERWTQAAVSASRWARTRFVISMTEGNGETVTETKTGLVGRVEGARWCPRLTLDFRTVAEPEFAGQLRMRPAWKSTARFRNNTVPVTGADVAATVTGAERVAVGTPWLEVPVENQPIRDAYRDARELALHTLLADRKHATEIASRVRQRFDPAQRTADARQWRKDALRLQLTDEILLYHHRFGLSVGKACRVASLASVLALNPLTDLTTWR